MNESNEKGKKPAEDAPAGEQFEKPAKKKEPAGGNNKGLIIGIIAGVIIVEILMLFVFMKVTRPHPKEEAEAKAVVDSTKEESGKTSEKEGEIVEAPIQAIVNVAGTDGMRFLKIALSIECDKLSESMLKEMEKQTPKLRNILIDLLSNMSLDELNSPEARDRIRKEFLKRANKVLPEKLGLIHNAYITEFIMQ